MNVPKHFEFTRVCYQFKEHRESSVFVTVLDKFQHYYTGTKMYHIRIEHDGTFGMNTETSPVVEYKTVTEDQMYLMLLKRKKDA